MLLQKQYDDEKKPVASGTIKLIECYAHFTENNPDIVKADQEMGMKDEAVYIKDFIDASDTDKKKSLKDYRYKYYISEANVVSGQSVDSDISATTNYQTGGINSSGTLTKFLTAICGEAPNNQRVILEVVFRAVSK